MNWTLFFAALALSLDVAPAAAQAYKCLENGKTTISTSPCPAGAVTRAEIAAEPLPDAEAVALQEARLQRYVDGLARERQARDAAQAAEQKARAEQAVLEARAQREKAEAEVLRANAERRVTVYDAPFYGYGRLNGGFRGYGVRRNTLSPGLSVRVQSGNVRGNMVRGNAGRGRATYQDNRRP
jgi:multidrug efflux pump subunit AcrA (membrane-fusion protein)